jgi:hypothetical protein
MTKYKLVSYQGKDVSVMKYEDNVFVCGIPFNPDNTDYQAYLKWVAEGNTPEPADE